MIRIRAGESWKLNPQTVAALRALAPPAARRHTPGEILDHLGIEVDGVDISAGLGEGDLFRTVRDLVRAVTELLGGKPKAQIALGDGPVELILVPAGGDFLLSVVSLARPSRVLVRDIAVDAARFATEAAGCADALLHDLRRINPALTESPLARALASAVTRLRTRARRTSAASPPASGAPGSDAPGVHPAARPRDPPPAPGQAACGFDLADEEGLLHTYSGDGQPDLHSLLARGHLVLRLADGREASSHDGPPFLALRDLVSDAARLVAAWEAGEREFAFEFGPGGDRVTLDLGRGRCAVARARPGAAREPARKPAPAFAVPEPVGDTRPLDLARALLDAAIDFSAAVAAREPRQAHNPYLRELHRHADERLRYLRQLAEGDLFGEERPPAARERRRTPRPEPEAPLGPGALRRVVFRETWRAPVGPVLPEGLFLAAAAPAAGRGAIVVAAGPSGLHGLDATTGTERWSLPASSPVFVARPDGPAPARRVLAAEPDGFLLLLDASTGETRWRRRTRLAEGGLIARRLLELPGDALACVLDRRVVACTDAATGRFHWRFAPPEANRADIAAGDGLVYVAADNGFLYALHADNGRVAWRLRTAMHFLAPPIHTGRVLLALGAGAAGPSLLGIDPRTGRPRFTTVLDLDGAHAPLLWRGMAVVPGEAAGTAEVAAVSLRSGRIRFRTRLPGAPRGTPSVSASGPILAAAAAGGAAARLDAKGTVLWSRRPRGDAPAPPAPILRRDLALFGGEPTLVLHPESGDLMDALRPPAPLPVQWCAGVATDLFLCDDEGPVVCYRLATHLSLVG